MAMPKIDDSALLHMQYVGNGQVRPESGSADYDAEKAHQYYLANRKLKGRKPAAEKVTGTRSKPGVVNKVLPKSKSMGLVKSKATLKPTMSKEQVKARVTELQKRLASLKVILANLVKQLRESDGKATKAVAKEAASTSKDKVSAAKSSAKYYDKNKAAIAAKAKTDAAANNPSDLEGQIKVIQDKIAKMRADLAGAMKR